MEDSTPTSGVQGTTQNNLSNVNKFQWITVAILTYVNLINYMDRFTITGILRQFQEDFQINNGQAGALQATFVCSFMVFAPIFGYFGDRHSRKLIMAIGVLIWSGATLLGSFMPNYGSFLAMRALVGMGEASFTTLAPTIISDLFFKELRSKILGIFYFAVPVGSGLGYIIGRGLANAFGHWRWALRGTPLLGLLAIILIVFVLEEPPRGKAEGQDQLKASSYMKDLKTLARNMTFVFSTLGSSCLSFCTGALAFWGPVYLETALYSMEVPDAARPVAANNVALIFGILTMLSGILGVPLGALLSTCLRKKYPTVDPLISGTSLILSSLFILGAFFLARDHLILAFAIVFIGSVALNLNWSITADLLLYVVLPIRRGTARALQILFSHLLGDAGSPYIIGVLIDALKLQKTNDAGFCADLNTPDAIVIMPALNNTQCEVYTDYFVMQYSLMLNVVVEALGGVFFFVCAIFVVKDSLRVRNYQANHSGEQQRHSEDVAAEVDSTSRH